MKLNEEIRVKSEPQIEEKEVVKPIIASSERRKRPPKNQKPSAIGFLLKWLEGNQIVGPSLECFVLAMMNKSTFENVKAIYGISDFKEFEKLHYK
jgi:hypothetical protein